MARLPPRRRVRGLDAPAFVSGHPREWASKYNDWVKACVRAIQLEYRLAKSEGRPCPFDERQLVQVFAELKLLQERLRVLIPMQGYDVQELALHARSVYQDLLDLTHHIPRERRGDLP